MLSITSRKLIVIFTLSISAVLPKSFFLTPHSRNGSLVTSSCPIGAPGQGAQGEWILARASSPCPARALFVTASDSCAALSDTGKPFC